MLAVLLPMSLLSGCSSANEFGLTLTEGVNKQLRPHEAEGIAAVSLDFIPTWDRIVIACPGATTRAVEKAIGSEWIGSREVTRTDFLGMIVFLDGPEVSGFFEVGQNDFYENHFYFTPCPVDPMEIVGDFPRVTLVERSQSALTFQYSARLGYWYIDAKTLSEAPQV